MATSTQLRAPRRTSRPRTAGAVAVTAALLLGLGACTADPQEPDTGLGGPEPSSSSTDPGSSGTSSSAASGDGAASSTFVTVAVTVADGADGGPAQGRSLTVPEGWSAEVWADVAGARLAAWTPDGSLVVSTGDRGILELLTPTSPGSAPERTTLLAGLDNPQGVAFTEQDGRDVLVLGEATRIVAWDYADGAVTDERVLVDGLPSDGHGSKGVTVQGGTVYYSLGSAENRDPADRSTDPERGTVWQVRLDGSDNELVASGVRNGFALDVAPDDTLFVAVNQADNQPYPFQDDTGRYGEVVPEYVNENPVEPLTRITPGTDLGWPLCVPDTRDSADLTDLPYVEDPENNPDGSALDCASLPSTMVGLPSHSAPLGLEFTAGTTLEETVGRGAIVAAHGSWNRRPPRPPYVAFSPWDDETATLGAPVELVTGFQEEDGSRWGRAVTAVPGPDGSLYVTDDEAGLVYRLTPGA
ncbi:sorbosone dehydrogenase family protein [Cellulosimicrobium sp. CUA-896]|uniref:PQQ-dependent sugar dehydrogenase n=1 Tax=Cellulosimicrobium sp. CUA-896 TaxID=1517881 RepID=UPI00095C2E66|nr:sugar dehydrogenase [Cellulosimicrobium sp. CUA-896]OLT52273.1 sugar dehydrogenase [Cellulosimicrobium sp. CUA-896]